MKDFLKKGTACTIFSLFLPAQGLSRTIFDLQKFIDIYEEDIPSETAKKGNVKLINLNRNIEKWYLLAIIWPGEVDYQFFHLENPYPTHQFIRLSTEQPGSLEILSFANKKNCLLFKEKKNSPLIRAGLKKSPYAPLCTGRVLLRNPTEGNVSSEEKAVNFLRNNIWKGENFINLLTAL